MGAWPLHRERGVGELQRVISVYSSTFKTYVYVKYEVKVTSGASLYPKWAETAFLIPLPSKFLEILLRIRPIVEEPYAALPNVRNFHSTFYRKIRKFLP